MENRVCFYGTNDLSIGYNLELAEKAIAKYKSEPASTLTDVIELYHIKKLIDNTCQLKCWSNTQFNQIKDDIKDYNSIIAKYFAKLQRNSLADCYDALDWDYRQAFWEIIDLFKIYHVIDGDFISYIAEGKYNELMRILHCKGVVEKFKMQLRQIMLNDCCSAHILIDKYIARHNHSANREIFLPSNLSMKDKVALINAYLNSEDPNINYVRLICQNKDDKNELELDPCTRVKAERLARKMNDELMSDYNNTIEISSGFTIAFSDEDGIEPVDYKQKDDCKTYTYSIKYIHACNHTQLVANCATMFYWTNRHGLLELINKSSEVETLETTFMDIGRNAYPAYDWFQQKNYLAMYQLHGYNKTLAQINTSLECELKIFYEERLRKEYDYSALKLNFPNPEDNWLNKCRVLFPELDSIVKQYNTYVLYDEIDPDIIKFSKPLKMNDGKSLLTNKYYEINQNTSEIHIILFYLFASGSTLNHVTPYKEKHYQSLFDLLNHEVVYYNYYEKYQRPHIDFLLSHDMVLKDENGQLSLPDNDLKMILKSLWEYRVCAYWHYSKNGMEYLDDMVKKGWLTKSDNLLTTEERRYFSYYMDNGEFTNGFAYRNHYAHGSTPPEDDANTHHTAYLVFLRLLSILILKIDDDLWSARRAFAIGMQKQTK